ncbi:unnamed protein product, partial [marine sediment metagenome]
MMTRREHLLKILEEECGELAHVTSKAMRFGLGDIKPGGRITNAKEIYLEFVHIIAMIEMLEKENIINPPNEFELVVNKA